MPHNKWINLSQLTFTDFLSSGMVIQKPGSDELWLGINNQMSQGVIGSNHSAIFYYNDFFCQNFTQNNPQKIIKTTLPEFFEWIGSNFTKKTKLIRNIDCDQEFKHDVEKILNWIKNDKIVEKLVAVTMASYKFDEFVHPLSQIENLLKLNGSLYGMWHGNKGFLGVSPEPLFIKTNTENWYQTRALAGTINNQMLDYKKILLNDPKETQEHQMVVDDIKNKLKIFSEEIEIGKTNVLEFGSLAHICTEINFKVDNISPKDLIKKLSPTAALGGFPNNDDLVFSLLKQLKYYDLEGNNRMFGGVMGLKTDEESLSLVGIRNISWSEDSFQIHSGCGVVEGSDVLKELNEVQNKRKLIEQIYI